MDTSKRNLILGAIVAIALIAMIPVFYDSFEGILNVGEEVEEQAETENLTDTEKINKMMAEIEPTDLEDTFRPDEIGERNFAFEGPLLDVTSGLDVRGINTAGNSVGVAKSIFEDGEYLLFAEILKLPDPIGTDFYEGWVVRSEPFDFISTGALTKVGEKYINEYGSALDLTEYDFYVLTLEPNDGDPAPADHIVEGTMVAK